MNASSLKFAISEAERFVKIAKKVKTEFVADARVPYTRVYDYTKESAACKRASMDLTRALTQLRKP